MENSPASPVEPPLIPAPLLPPVLLSPASFLWLWVLPLAILGLLNLQGYWLIGSEMNDEQRSGALLIGLAGCANLAAGIGVFFFSKFGRRGGGPETSHPLWGLPGLLMQIVYLWLAMMTLGDGLLPRNVTAWIYPESRFVFNQFAFCMLPAFLGLLRLAAARPQVSLGRALALSGAAAAGAPVALYVMFQSFALLKSDHGYRWLPYFFATMVIVSGAVMFFGVLRGLLLALSKAQAWHVTGERWAVVVLALVLPLAGLTLNITIPFPVDFQAIEVYVLTVANALVLLFAVWTGGTRPRLSWHLLCATFPFALYFFIVFLPFIPLSVLAVIVVGTGLLVLTPILLFALHLHLLAKAWRQVAEPAARRGLLLGGALAVLLLPAFFTVRGLADKAALNAALDYLYEPTVAAGDVSFDSSLTNLRRAVNSHRGQKEGIYYPLLSDYYSWLVFDNLVLPDGKLNDIDRVFFGARADDGLIDPLRKDEGDRSRGRAGNRKRLRPVALPPQTVEMEKLLVRAAPVDAASTVVTLGLALRNTRELPAEYVTTLTLPAGVLVRGFRLQVGDTLVPGRIFERKTALWVYSMIRDRERRDPGILYYRNASELELRVFPILAEKPVTVELDLLVPARMTADQLPGGASLGGVLAEIGRLTGPVETAAASGERVLAGLGNLPLPAAEREPYLHVIVDRSKEHGFTGDFAAAWTALRAKFPEARQARITAANYEVTSLSPGLTPIERAPTMGVRELDQIMPLSGGLALDLALAHAIRMHRDRELDAIPDGAGPPPRPIFVILSRHAVAQTPELPLTEAWADLLPGLEVCGLGTDGSFVIHREITQQAAPLLRAGSSMRPLVANRVVRFPPSSAKAGLHSWDAEAAQWRPLAAEIVSLPDAGWTQAVDLQRQQQELDRNPGGSGLSRRALVEASRKTGVLLASASYIVVENQAQWKVLETGERQKLGQNQALEFVETPAPPGLWIALGFAGWLLLRRWRNTRRLRIVNAGRAAG